MVQFRSGRAHRVASLVVAGLMIGAAPALASPFSGGGSSGGAIEGGEGAPGGGVGIPGAIVNNVRVADATVAGVFPWSDEDGAATARAYYPRHVRHHRFR